MTSGRERLLHCEAVPSHGRDEAWWFSSPMVRVGCCLMIHDVVFIDMNEQMVGYAPTQYSP